MKNILKLIKYIFKYNIKLKYYKSFIMKNLISRKKIKISILNMFFLFYIIFKNSVKKLKIGVIGVRHDNIIFQ